MRLACDTFLIVTQEAFYCYPTRYCLLHSPQHSWGIRFFIYGKQDEIKSTKLIREATITKNRTNNKAYVEGMVDIITSYDAAIFAVIMDKPDEPIIVPEHHLPKQYYLLLKKVEFYCNHHHYGKAMMIFDEVHEDADRKIAEAITGFLFEYSGWFYISCPVIWKSLFRSVFVHTES